MYTINVKPIVVYKAIQEIDPFHPILCKKGEAYMKALFSDLNLRLKVCKVLNRQLNQLAKDIIKSRPEFNENEVWKRYGGTVKIKVCNLCVHKDIEIAKWFEPRYITVDLSFTAKDILAVDDMADYYVLIGVLYECLHNFLTPQL